MDEKALFTKFWTQEAKTTSKVISRIPENNGYKPDPKSRTAMDIAWQIVCEEKMLIEAMDGLNEREKHILTERRLTENPQTLEELSQVYDVSRERIRQIEVRAFEKLQKAMQRIAGERLLPGIA